MLLAIARESIDLSISKKTFEIDGSFFIEIRTRNPFYLFRKVKRCKIKTKKLNTLTKGIVTCFI